MSPFRLTSGSSLEQNIGRVIDTTQNIHYLPKHVDRYIQQLAKKLWEVQPPSCENSSNRKRQVSEPWDIGKSASSFEPQMQSPIPEDRKATKSPAISSIDQKTKEENPRLSPNPDPKSAPKVKAKFSETLKYMSTNLRKLYNEGQLPQEEPFHFEMQALLENEKALEGEDSFWALQKIIFLFRGYIHGLLSKHPQETIHRLNQLQITNQILWNGLDKVIQEAFLQKLEENGITLIIKTNIPTPQGITLHSLQEILSAILGSLRTRRAPLEKHFSCRLTPFLNGYQHACNSEHHLTRNFLFVLLQF